MSEENGIVISSVSDLMAFVRDLSRNEETVGARSYTKDEGFKNVTILEKSDPTVLVGMAGCILVALSNQFANGLSGSEEGIDLISEFASQVKDVSADIRAERERYAKFDSQIENLANGAFALGFIDTDPADMSTVDRLTSVRDYVKSTGTADRNADLMNFLDSQISEVANS